LDSAGSGRDSWPEISALLRNGASDGCTLHFTLGVNDDSTIVFKVKEDTLFAAPRFALANNDGAHDLLAKLRLTFFNGAHNEIAHSSSGERVEAALHALDGNDVDVLCARVIAAIDYSTHRKSEGDSDLFMIHKRT